MDNNNNTPILIGVVLVIVCSILISISFAIAVSNTKTTTYSPSPPSSTTPPPSSTTQPPPSSSSSEPEPNDPQAPAQEVLTWTQMSGWWPYGYDAGNSMPATSSLNDVKSECAKRDTCKFITQLKPGSEWRLVRDFRSPMYEVTAKTYINSRSDLIGKSKPDIPSIQWKQFSPGVVNWTNATGMQTMQYIKGIDLQTAKDVCAARACKAINVDASGQYTLFKEFGKGPKDTTGKIKTYVNSRHPNYNNSTWQYN